MKGVRSFHFNRWIIFFFSTLLSISLFIYWDLIIIAKIIGVITTCVLVIVIRYWLHLIKKKSPSNPRVHLNSNDRYELSKYIIWYGSLKPGNQKIIEHRIGVILSSITINTSCSLNQNQFSDRFSSILISLFLFLDTNVNPSELIMIHEVRVQLEKCAEDKIYLINNNPNEILDIINTYSMSEVLNRLAAF